MRLDKFLANAGVASRRAAKGIVHEGRVSINGETAAEPGLALDEHSDTVLVDGEPVSLPEGYRYVIMNKPQGYLCTSHDPRGRQTVFDLLDGVPERLFTVGRLDLDADGLLLLTNDGALAHRLTHPTYGVQKIYIVTTRERATQGKIARLREGVEVEGRHVTPDSADILDVGRDGSRIRVVIHDGRKHQVKIMCSSAGLPVSRLQRVQYGPLELGNLPRSQHRDLMRPEVRALEAAVGLDADARAALTEPA